MKHKSWWWLINLKKRKMESQCGSAWLSFSVNNHNSEPPQNCTTSGSVYACFLIRNTCSKSLCTFLFNPFVSMEKVQTKNWRRLALQVDWGFLKITDFLSSLFIYYVLEKSSSCSSFPSYTSLFPTCWFRCTLCCLTASTLQLKCQFKSSVINLCVCFAGVMAPLSSVSCI